MMKPCFIQQEEVLSGGAANVKPLLVILLHKIIMKLWIPCFPFFMSLIKHLESKKHPFLGRYDKLSSFVEINPVFTRIEDK